MKEKDQRCFQSSPLPKDATYRSDGQYQKAQRRTKSRNEQMNFFLQGLSMNPEIYTLNEQVSWNLSKYLVSAEHLQIAKVDNDDDDTNG